MNRLLNYIRITLTLLLTVVLFGATLISVSGFLDFIPLLLYFFVGGTTILDLIRKNHFTNKHNVISIMMMIVILLIIIKPLFDALLSIPIGTLDILQNIGALFKQNQLLIIIIISCLFLLNYIDYKIK